MEGATWQHINGGSTQPFVDDFTDGGIMRKIIMHPSSSNSLHSIKWGFQMY